MKTYYVRTSASAGGDGTTDTDSGGSHAYQTLNAALSARAADITADDNYEFICSVGSGSSADTTQATVSSTWVTDATHTVTIKCATDNHHGGKWDDTVYRIIGSQSAAGMLVINTAYCTVKGLQVRNTNSGNSARSIHVQAGGGEWNVLGCIINNSGTGTPLSNNYAFFNNGQGSGNFVNNVVYGRAAHGVFASAVGSSLTVNYYNNTIDCGDTGAMTIAAGTGAEYVRNNVLKSNGGTDWNNGSMSGGTGGNCCTDTSGPDSLNSKTFTFKDAANGDYRLDVADTGASGNGVDLSADGTYSFNTDIESELAGKSIRSAWDSGADEKVVVLNFYVNTDTGSDATSRGEIGTPWASLNYGFGAVGGLRGTNNAKGVNYSNLVDEQVQIVMNCSGSAEDTTEAQVNGMTSSIDYFLTISGEGNDNGKYDATKYRMHRTTSGNNAWCLRVNTAREGLVIEDMQFKLTNTGGTNAVAACEVAFGTTAGPSHIRRCIAVGTISGASSVGIGFYMGATNVSTMRALLAYDFINGANACYGIYNNADNTAQDTLIDNCTVENCDTGFWTNWNRGTVRNCLAQNCNDGFIDTARWDSSSYNCSDLASDAPGTNAIQYTAGFTDLGNEDYHLTATDASNLAGTDLSGTFDYDLENNAWTSWYVGALQQLTAFNVTGAFATNYGLTQPNLSGLSWAWFDENIGALNAPTAQGAVETSDSAGDFLIDVTGTALSNGQTGTLVLYDSTGEKYGAYRAIIGANGTIRFDAPTIGSSYYFDDEAGVIGVIATPPMGPWR